MSPSSLRQFVAFSACSLALLASGCYSPTGGNLFTNCCTVTGVVKRSTGEPIPGIDVWVSPTGLTSTVATTNANGLYSAYVPTTTGVVTLNNIPDKCQFPAAPVPYDVAGHVTTEVDFSLTCSP